MARIFNVDAGESMFDDPDVELAIDCPRCGCNDTKITKAPRPGSWFGATGTAACNFCGAGFSIRIQELDEDGNEVRPGWMSNQTPRRRKED